MRETVNTRLPPSVTEVSAIEIPDWSLSRMVPVATASPSVGVASGLAPCGFVSVTVTVSSVSLMLSPTVATVMVFDSSPGAKVTVPESGPLRSPSSAEPRLTA